MEKQCILTTCGCKEFQHYFRCEHVIMYAIAKLGHRIIPRGEDIRWVSERVTAGRPVRYPNCYGVPFLDAEANKKKRKRARALSPGPSSPRAVRAHVSSQSNFLALN